MSTPRKPTRPAADGRREQAAPVTRPLLDRGSPAFSVEHDGSLITGPDEASVREFVAAMERQKALRDRWPQDGREAMTALAALFPSMRRVPGTSPWEVEALIEWSNSGAPTSGSIWAARFLLSVWNSSTNWNVFGLPGAGKFDLFEAWSCWDDHHRKAALEWLEAPFWP
jgi:hypothetical protein